MTSQTFRIEQDTEKNTKIRIEHHTEDES